MSIQTIRPTAMKPSSEELMSEPMSPLATMTDLGSLAVKVNDLGTISQVDSVATDIPGVVADLNTLLANLRTMGVLAP